MRCREQSVYATEIAACGRLFSSPFALRDVAARRPVSGFGIGVRHVAERRWICATWRQCGRDTGETERGRRPTSGEDSAQRSASRVPGERLCRLTGETEKASGESPALANIAVLLWYPSLGVLPLAYFSTTSAAMWILPSASVLQRISTAPSAAMYFA